MIKRKIEHEGIRWPRVILTGVAAIGIYAGLCFLFPKTFYDPIFKPKQKQEEIIKQAYTGLNSFVFEKPQIKKIQKQPQKQPQLYSQYKQENNIDISKLPEPEKHGGFLANVSLNNKDIYNINNLIEIPYRITSINDLGETLSVDTGYVSVSLDTTFIDESKIEKILKSGEKVEIKQEHNHKISR